MSFIRTADEPRIPLRGVFWILMYLLAGRSGRPILRPVSASACGAGVQVSAEKPVDSLLARTAGAMQTGAVKRARQEYMLALLASGVKRRALEAAVAADEADQRAAEAASQSLNRPRRRA